MFPFSSCIRDVRRIRVAPYTWTISRPAELWFGIHYLSPLLFLRPFVVLFFFLFVANLQLTWSSLTTLAGLSDWLSKIPLSPAWSKLGPANVWWWTEIMNILAWKSRRIIKRKTSIHAKSWQVNIKNSRRLNSLTAGHMTSVGSSGRGVFCFFFIFFKICLSHPYTSVSLKFLRTFRNFRNLWNTGRIRKLAVIIDINPFLTDYWSKLP